MGLVLELVLELVVVSCDGIGLECKGGFGLASINKYIYIHQSIRVENV